MISVCHDSRTSVTLSGYDRASIHELTLLDERQEVDDQMCRNEALRFHLSQRVSTRVVGVELHSQSWDLAARTRIPLKGCG